MFSATDTAHPSPALWTTDDTPPLELLIMSLRYVVHTGATMRVTPADAKILLRMLDQRR